VEATRAAELDDLGRIVELAGAMRAELEPMKGGQLWARRERAADPLDVTYRALLDRDDARMVVGTVADVVIGFGVAVVEPLRDGGALGVLTDLFVEPGARGVGVGEAMTRDLVAFCDARRCVGVDALALPGHRATKNFFEGSGFTARALVMHRASGSGASGSGASGSGGAAGP